MNLKHTASYRTLSHSLWLMALVLALALALPGCSFSDASNDGDPVEDDGNGDDDNPTIFELSFTNGGTAKLVVGAQYANPALVTGATSQTSTVAYLSTNTEVATVDSTGTVTALTAGSSIIRASLAEKTVSYRVDVLNRQVTLGAWVGTDGAQLLPEAGLGGTQLLASSYVDCDPSEPSSCDDARTFLVGNSAITDAEFVLGQGRYYQLKHGGNTAKFGLSAAQPGYQNETHSVLFKGQLWLVGNAYSSHYTISGGTWSSTDGIYWHPHPALNINGGAALSFARQGHQLVVFDADDGQGEQLWLIGGVVGTPEEGKHFTSDVWSSTDGIHWQQQTADAGFPGRADHQAVVFDGGDGPRLWVMGGRYDGFETLGDVWSSADGITWTQHPPQSVDISDSFSLSRYGHQLVVFDDGEGEKLWLIGGINDNTDLNNLWSSVDGVHWRAHTPLNVNSGEPSFSGLRYHEVVRSTVGDGQQRLWLIGGDGLSDVWSSVDGVHWQQHSPNALWSKHWSFFGQDTAQGTLHSFDSGQGEQLWWVGSSGWQETFGTLSSVDGEDWVYQSPWAPFAGRTDHQMVVFNADDSQGPQLWMVGGKQLDEYNDVWSSPDGLTWTEHLPVNSNTGESVFTPRSGHQLVVFDGGQGERLWIIGGQDSSDALSNEIWSSADGDTWTQHASTASRFASRHGHQVVNFQGQLWLVGGETSGGYVNDVWSSSDGVNWTKVNAVNTSSNEALFAPRSGHQMVNFQGQLWLIGGHNSGGYRSDVWSSSDGVNWTQEESVGVVFAARSEHQVVVFNNGQSERLWLVGGGGLTDYGTLNDVWSSLDGRNWQQHLVTEDSGGLVRFAARKGHQLAVMKNSTSENAQLWLVGGSKTKYSADNEIWKSSDGVHWQLGLHSTMEFADR